MNMVQVCIFVPFLNEETPKPLNVVKIPTRKDNIVPCANLIALVLDYRVKIAIA
jgi:hypothetical protein